MIPRHGSQLAVWRSALRSCVCSSMPRPSLPQHLLLSLSLIQPPLPCCPPSRPPKALAWRLTSAPPTPCQNHPLATP